MLEEINCNKRKPFVIFAFSSMALILMSVSTIIGCAIINRWFGIIAGLAFMLIALPVHILAKRHSYIYILSFLLNSIGTGLSVSAYYTVKKVYLDYTQILIAILLILCILLMTAFFLLKWPSNKKTIIVAISIVLTLLLISSIFLWVIKGLVVFSFGFFSTLLALFYILVFAVSINTNRSLFRDISYGSFGGIIILTMVVILILSEGDFLDVLDFSGGGKKSKKKSHKRFQS